MKLLKVTGSEVSPTFTVQFSKDEFSQLITVASAAHGAAQVDGTKFYTVEQIGKIVNFYNALKNIGD